MKTKTGCVLRLLAIVLFTAFAAFPQQKVGDERELATYIDKAWDTLTRSMTDCETITDKRVPEHSLMYLPAHSRRRPRSGNSASAAS